MPIIIGRLSSGQSGGGTDHTAEIAVIKAKDQSQDTLISEASAKNIEQDTRIDSVESSVLSKADLVSGKVPLTQLPDLPVGRKVSVADTPARLLLTTHPDITIAYQIDTGDAWVLDSGEDPSVEVNWDKLGNAQAQGVTAFNSRTGVVVPTIGDYTTDIVEPTTNRTYTTPAERTSWNSKVSPEQMDSRISLFSDSLVGVFAPLEDGKVPSTYLPAPAAGGATQEELTRIAALEGQTTSLSSKDTELQGLITGVNSKADSVASNNVVLDQRLATLENAPAATDYSPAITAVQEKNTAQDARLASIDAALINKAPLVSGKVPYENLPEFPVGRKVNVADRAARLLLPSYADLTIAYESDTGDAWGLDSNDDPSIDANWSKLGNAQGVGVASFNGRTGNIGPLNGDYITNQISETLTKQFVTPEQKTEWTAKETTSGAQTKATAAQTAATLAAKTYADATFTPLTQKGVANGVASLDGTGKVPAAQLLTNVIGGVPILDVNNRISSGYLYRNSANGVAGLDANAKVPIANLPDFLPQSKRIWRDVKSQRTTGTWYINTSPNERDVYVRASLAGAPANRFVSLRIRESTGSTIFTFNSTVLLNVGTSLTYADSNTITVPPGWQFQLGTNGGSTDALTELWYELY